jgi:hypothetical protein
MEMQAARLSLDGSSMPIVARIERCSKDALVVGRKLPFLRLGTRVRDERGRAGAISRVSMNIEDGIPHLSVELDYDPLEVAPPEVAPLEVIESLELIESHDSIAAECDDKPGVRVRRDETLSYEMRSSRPSFVPSAPRLDDTNHDRTLDLALSVTQVLPQEPRAFVPSLHPMPLPIPESLTRAPRAGFWHRAITFMATLSAFFLAAFRTG